MSSPSCVNGWFLSFNASLKEEVVWCVCVLPVVWLFGCLVGVCVFACLFD